MEGIVFIFLTCLLLFISLLSEVRINCIVTLHCNLHYFHFLCCYCIKIFIILFTPVLFYFYVCRRHTLALVPSRGRVYSFGLGGAGQLGTRAVLNSSTPQVVLGPWLSPSGKALMDSPDSNTYDHVIKRIFAGGDHCFVTVTHQKVIVSFIYSLISISLSVIGYKSCLTSFSFMSFLKINV